MTMPSQRPSRFQEQTSGTLVSLVQRTIPGTVRGIISAVLALGGVLAIFLGGIFWLFFLQLRGVSYTVLALGGSLILVSLMLSFAAVRQSITGRRGRYSANTVVMILAFVALGILVFVIGDRNAVRWDLTATQQFSLAQQTVQILEGIPEPVRVTGFFVPGQREHERFRGPVENLLNEFRHRSDGGLEYRFVDPDLRPTLTTRYGVSRYPALVFEGEESGRTHVLNAPLFEERDMASALLIVSGIERKQVYFLTGHGEHSMDDTQQGSREGYGLAASGMITDNYAVSKLALAQDPTIPENAAAIVIPGPEFDLTEEETDLLHEYLKSGGRMLLLLDPEPPQAVKDLLARWGIKVNDGTIIDLGSSLAGQPRTPLIKREQFAANTPQVEAITDPLDQSYFPGAISFQRLFPQEEMPDTVRVLPVARTSILSCTTLDPDVDTCPGASPQVFVPVWAVQASAPINEEPPEDVAREARLVVFGDSDFATNFHLFSLNNNDLFLNSLNWLTEDVALAAVRSKPFAVRQLVVTGSEMQVIRALGWFVLPVLMAILAGVAWWRRR